MKNKVAGGFLHSFRSVEMTIATILAVLTLISCEVGLGEAVDITPPKVDIEYPISAAVITDSFYLYGNCNDDKEIASVSVEAENTTTKEVVTFSTEISSDKKKWQARINELENGKRPLVDGKYEFKAIAKDAAGRESSIYTRTFQIDNTKPIFIIKNPNSINPDSPSSFGREFKVEGSIAEENSVKLMQLTVYKYSKASPNIQSKVCEWEEEDINVAGSTSVTFASCPWTSDANPPSPGDKDWTFYSRYVENNGVTNDGIYDMAVGGDQFYRLEIKLMDNAKKYQTAVFQGSRALSTSSQNSQDLGNVTTSLWRNDDISGTTAGNNAIMGSFGKAALGGTVEVGDLMRIMNGTYTGEADADEVKRRLAATETDTAKDDKTGRLAIKINKDANPKWTIMGYSFAGGTAETTSGIIEATKNGTVTFQGSAGLDGTTFSPQDISVYLFGPYLYSEICDGSVMTALVSDIYSVRSETEMISLLNLPANANTIKNKLVKVYYTDRGETSAELKQFLSNNTRVKAENLQAARDTKSVWTEALPLPDELESGQYYLFATTGHDGENVEFLNENSKYNGFKALANGNPPNVEITKPLDTDEKVYKTVQEALNIEGVLKSTDHVPLKTANYIISVKKGQELLGTMTELLQINPNSASSQGSGNLKVSRTTENQSYALNFTIGKSGFNAGSVTWKAAKSGVTINDVLNPTDNDIYKYIVKIEVTADGPTGYSSVEVQVDKKLPEVKVRTIEPYAVDENNAKKYNGTITISGSVTDETKIKSVKLQVYSDRAGTREIASLSETVTASVSETTEKDFNFSVDTTEIKDASGNYVSGECLFKITAEDACGNKKIDNSTVLFVDQESDRPKILPSNFDFSIKTSGAIQQNANLFDQTGNNKLLGTVTDDDAVKVISLSYRKKGQAAWSSLASWSNLNTTSTAMTVSLQKADRTPLDEGEYEMQIEAQDKFYTNTATTPFNYKNSDVFLFAIDASDPIITISTVQDEYKGSTFNVVGTITESSDTVTLTRTSKNQTTAKNITPTLKSGSTTEWEWTDSVSAVTGDNVIYTATDKYGRTRTAKFNYLVDDANPNLAISSPTDDASYLPATKTTIKSFSGTANDNDGTVHSGIEKVEYSKDGGATWISANGTSEWSCDVNFAPTTGTIQAGSKTVKFRAVDNSGRISTVSEKTVIVDTEPPVIADAVTIKVSNQAVTADGGVYYLNSGTFTISGTATDTNFSTLKYGTQILSSASGAFNATISGLSQGSQTIELTAEDKAGQKTTKAINVFIDTTAPTNLQVNVSPLISDTIAGSGLGQKDDYVNGIITVKASATDNDKVKSSKIEIYKGQAKIAESGTFTANATNVTKTFDTTAAGWTDDSEYTVKFIVTDRAKNQATSQTTKIFVCQKTDKPKITSTNTNLTLTDTAQITNGSNLFGMGANTIYVGVTDDDGLSSVQYQIDGGTWKDALITSGSASATLSIDVSQLKGRHTLKIKASDTSKDLNGAVRAVNAETAVVAFAVDSEEPKVTVTAFGVDSNTANDKPYSKDMYLPTSFTIKGTATDDSGIKSLKLKSTKINGTVTGAPANTPNLASTEAASQNWNDALTGQEGNIERTYEVIDIYGRKSETTISYKVDKTAPEFNSAFITLNGANTTGNNSIPSASYNSQTTYFSTQNIKISGTGDQAVNSQTKGNKAVFDVNPDVIEVTVITGQGAATHTDTSTVSYGTEGSFSTNVGLSDGTSTVRITARDVAGNSSSPLSYLFKIDSTPPTVQNPSVASSLKYNKAQKDAGQAISVPITASDNIGLKTVVVQKQGKDAITQNISGTATAQGFSVSIPASYIEDGVNTFSVYVTDVANNMSVKEAFAITTDIGVPKIRVTSHQNNAIVNKTVHLIGIATDASGVTATDGKIQVKTNGSTTWANAVSGAVTNFTYNENTSEWMCDFDTTKYVSTATVTQLSVRAVLKDTAGNVLTTNADDASSVSVLLSVNQNADRPNIRLNNILISGSSTTNDTIQGTVTDDDGIVKDLWYIAKSSLTGKDISYPLNVPSMTEDHGWTKATLDSGTGEWSIKLPSGASPRQEWHFYVIDQADGTFTTAQTGLKDILLSDATHANQAGTGGVSFYFDKTAPTVKIYVQATQTSVTSSPNATSSGWIDLNNVQVASKTFGKKKLWVKAEVTEPEAMRENDPLTLEYGSYSTQAIGTPSVSGNVYSYVFTEPINLQTHPKSGQVQLTVRAYDKAENSGRATGDIVVDIDSPVVDILTPKANTENAIIGATEIRGTVMDTYSEVSSLKWCVPKTSYGSSSVPEADWKEMNNWTRGDNTWTINFSSGDKTSQDSIMYYVSQHSTYAVVEETGGIYKVPIWFKPTDAVGNAVEIKTLFVYVDPDAGKPKAQIISPENNSVTGGTITFYGSSSDIDGAVTGIVLAIRQGTGNTSSPTWGTWQEYTNNTTPGVDGTTSWKFTMPALGNTVKKLQARVRAIDNDGNTRDFKADGSDAFTIAIDNNAPKLENIKLVQFGSGITNPTDTTPAKIERKYDPGMYLSNLTVSQNGDWYLVADVTTNVANIAEISFSTMAGNDINQSWQTIKPTSTKNYKMRLKLTTSVQSGKINYQIRVENSSTQRSSSSSTIQLNIDSKSPTIYVKSGAGKEGDVVNANTDATIFRLKTQGQLISETKSATETTVVNSNGYWTFGDVLDEAESGLQAVAFWIERANSFCSPMSMGTKKALSTKSTNQGAVYKNDDDLAVIYLSGLTRSDTTTISSASIGSNSTFIKKGGLVKIAGSYVKIANISGNTVTLATPVSTTHTTAEFVLANIIDHEVKETINASGGLENDDGDGMCETLSMLGSTYTWTASINSQNIKDGVATIHVVVIDNAGNVSRGTVKTKVENNRPRIAKVLLGTDLNGDGKFNYDAAAAPITFSADPRERTRDGTPFDEFYYYSCIDNNGNEQSVVTLKTGTGSSKYKVKDSLCVIPEFVGGDASDTNHHGTLNGTLKYVSDVIADTTNIPTTPLTGTGTNLKTLDTASTMLQKITSSGSSTINGQITDGGIILENTVFGSNAEKILRFTFWDATEETTQGTDSQYAILNIPINVMVNDTTKPTAQIEPFYWTNRLDNSVYYDENENFKGHIELTTDLPSSFTTSGTEINDRDPKVSGKIVLRGTVYDDTRLSKIAIQGESITGITNPATIATYSVQYKKWAITTSLAAPLSNVEVIDKGITQEGHTAEWKVVVDTEKLSGSAGLDKSLYVIATDAKGSNQNVVSGIGSTTGSTKTARYRVDIVPYITDIETGRSSFSRSQPSVYSRTTSGKYPVRENESITFKGYNLGGNPTVKLNNTTLKGATTTKSVGTVAGTGAFELTVSNVQALNNRNNNNAEYNKIKNGLNNDRLTDDVYGDVWEFKSVFNVANGSAKYVTMKISPDGFPGFSFANSVLLFSMPGYASDNGNDDTEINAQVSTTTNTFIRPNNSVSGDIYSQIAFCQDYGGFVDNTFAFDRHGNPYGVAACTDTVSNTKAAFLQFFSREQPMPEQYMWQRMNYNGTPNSSRLESLSGMISDTGNDGNDWVCEVDRFQSPSMETTHASSNTPTNDDPTYIYIAYYDKVTNQIRFRWGTVGTNSWSIDGKISTAVNYKRSSGQSAKEYVTTEDKTGVTYFDSNHRAYGLNDVYNANRTGMAESSQYAGTPTQGKIQDSWLTYSQNHNGGTPIQIICSGGSGTRYPAENTGRKPGSSVSLAIVGKDTANPTAVIAWHDKTNNKLRMAYNTNPTGSTTWTYKEICTGGLNVRIVADKDGGIHFAHYDNTNGVDLKYSYMSNVSATPTTVTIDSFGAVGAKPTIDVAKVGNNWVPYIGYQQNGYIRTPISTKIAYRDYNAVPDGGTAVPGIVGDTDKYSGAWEIAVVPTSNIAIDDSVNIGVNKNASGILSNFATGQDVLKPTVNNSVQNISGASKVYANGTSNPVVGYAIETGGIEMGQKK